MNEETADHKKTAYREIGACPAGNEVQGIELDLTQQGISMCNDHKRCKKKAEKIEIVMVSCVVQIDAC